MEAIGLSVNRLIRISYGPFRLGTLKPGDVEEIRGKIVREQLGLKQEDGGKNPAKRQNPQKSVSRRRNASPRKAKHKQ